MAEKDTGMIPVFSNLLRFVCGLSSDLSWRILCMPEKSVFFCQCWMECHICSLGPFGVSGSHWKKKSCLGLCIKYTAICNHKKIP